MSPDPVTDTSPALSEEAARDMTESTTPTAEVRASAAPSREEIAREIELAAARENEARDVLRELRDAVRHQDAIQGRRTQPGVIRGAAKRLSAAMERADAALSRLAPESMPSREEIAQLTSDLRAWLAVAKQSALRALPSEAPASPPSHADMAGFGASDHACYLYPGEDQAALRDAYVAGAQSAASASPPAPESDRIAELEAERDRLREALETCAALFARPVAHSMTEAWAAVADELSRRQKIARAALAPARTGEPEQEGGA